MKQLASWKTSDIALSCFKLKNAFWEKDTNANACVATRLMGEQGERERERGNRTKEWAGQQCKRNNNLRWFTIYRREIDKQQAELSEAMREAVSDAPFKQTICVRNLQFMGGTRPHLHTSLSLSFFLQIQKDNSKKYYTDFDRWFLAAFLNIFKSTSNANCAE